MSTRRIELQKALVVGVDVGSEEHVGFIRGPKGLEVGPFPFGNDRRGFRTLASKVSAAQLARGVKEVVVALEPTGPYGEALARWAQVQAWQVVGVLGAHTSRAKELWGNSPLKSDSKDAEVICDLAVDGKWVTFSLREGAHAELKALVVHREQLVRRQTALKNQVRALLRVVFPEFQRVMGSPGVFTRSGLRLLEQFPTPRSYEAVDDRQLSILLRRWSRGRLARDRARALLRAADQSVGVVAGLESRAWILRRAVRELTSLEGEIRAAEVRMTRALEDIPYAVCMLSMPAVGVVTAATLLGECGDLDNYPSARELLKFCGLNLVSSSSGLYQGRNRISKRGSRLARHQLYLLAGRLARSDRPWRGDYDRLRARGAEKKEALVALSRKAVRVLFALARDRAVYGRHAAAARVA